MHPDRPAQVVHPDGDPVQVERREEAVERLLEELESVANVAGLSEAPKPGRSSAITRLRSAIGGITLRHRNEDVGQPCSSRTGGPEPSSR